jgi:hypothetical protein
MYFKESPTNTATIEHIRDIEAGYYPVRDSETMDFTFHLKTDSPGKRRTYSWKPNKSDGIPIPIKYYSREVFIWINKDEINFNPKKQNEIQQNIQSALDALMSWNARSAHELKALIVNFLQILDNHIISETKEHYSFITPHKFVLNLSLADGYYYSYSIYTKINNSKKENNSDNSEKNKAIDINGNLLIMDKDCNIKIQPAPVHKTNHLTDIELYFYRVAEQLYTRYYDNEEINTIQVMASGTFIVTNGKSIHSYGMRIPKSYLIEVFGKEKVLGEEVLVEFKTESYDSIPYDKWPGKPQRQRKMNENEHAKYRLQMSAWINKNFNQNSLSETHTLYKQLLRMYYGIEPENINYPIEQEGIDISPQTFTCSCGIRYPEAIHAIPATSCIPNEEAEDEEIDTETEETEVPAYNIDPENAISPVSPSDHIKSSSVLSSSLKMKITTLSMFG